jgi:hypothetical protein
MLRKRSIRLTVVGAVLGVLLLPLSSAAAAPAAAVPLSPAGWTGQHHFLSAVWEGVWQALDNAANSDRPGARWEDRGSDPGSAAAVDLGKVIARSGPDADPNGCVTNPDGTITCPPPDEDPGASTPRTQY